MSTLQLDAENPWPGLESFDEASAAFFHGREAETQGLLLALRRAPLTVLYGQSGLGKTSLLRAGLFPLLRDADHLPVYIRLDHGEDSPPLADQVRQRLEEAAREARCELPLPMEGESLWAYFHRRDLDIWSERNRPMTPVLVFDQFEELFTLGRRATARALDISAFLAFLACLAENRAPAELAKELEDHPERAERFDFRKQEYKLLFAFREDFLPEVEGLRRLMPSIAHNRLRLLPLSQAQALDVVEKTGGALVTHEVADQIVRFVAAARHSEESPEAADALPPSEAAVEPALLSLVCAGLNNHRKERGLPAITADLLESCQRAIIEDFYAQSLAGLDLAVRAFIEDELLTRAGHRDSRALDDALAVPGMSQETIDGLVARRLLRIEERYGQKRLELTHDRLTGAVSESRERRQKEEAEAESRRMERVRRKRVLSAIAGVLGLVLLLSVFAGYSFVQWQRAEEQTRKAEQRKQAMMDAIKRVTSAVDRLLQRPDTSDLAREIFESNVALLAPLMVQEDESPEVLREKAFNFNRMGDVWMKFGDLGKARDAYRDAYQYTLEIRERLAGQDASNTEWQRDLSVSYEKIGDVLSAQGDLAGALKAFRASLEIRERLAGQDPSNTGWQRDLSLSLGKIGEVNYTMGILGDALANYQESLAILRRLAMQDPSNSQWRRDLALSLVKIGEVNYTMGILGNALANYQESLAILRRLAMQDPSNSQWQRDLSLSLGKIGEVNYTMGILGDALANYQESLAILQRLATQDPSNAQWQRDLAVSHNKIGDVLSAQGDLAGALKSFRDGLEMAERLAGQDPSNAQWQRDLAVSHINLGTVSEKQGKKAEARGYYGKARDILLLMREKHPDWAVIGNDLDWLEKRLKNLK
jgi:tetratricopeptide (TPR) repeat protein